jgi:hypothetical protein
MKKTGKNRIKDQKVKKAEYILSHLKGCIPGYDDDKHMSCHPEIEMYFAVIQEAFFDLSLIDCKNKRKENNRNNKLNYLDAYHFLVNEYRHKEVVSYLNLESNMLRYYADEILGDNIDTPSFIKNYKAYNYAWKVENPDAQKTNQNA